MVAPCLFRLSASRPAAVNSITPTLTSSISRIEDQRGDVAASICRPAFIASNTERFAGSHRSNSRLIGFFRFRSPIADNPRIKYMRRYLSENRPAIFRLATPKDLTNLFWGIRIRGSSGPKNFSRASASSAYLRDVAEFAMPSRLVFRRWYSLDGSGRCIDSQMLSNTSVNSSLACSPPERRM